MIMTYLFRALERAKYAVQVGPGFNREEAAVAFVRTNFERLDSAGTTYYFIYFLMLPPDKLTVEEASRRCWFQARKSRKNKA
jgi:hypothetical protein